MLDQLHPGADKLIEMLGFIVEEVPGKYIDDADGTWELFSIDEAGEEESVATGSYSQIAGTEGDYSAVVPGSDIDELELGLRRAKIVSEFTWAGDDDHDAGSDRRTIYYDVTERGSE